MNFLPGAVTPNSGNSHLIAVQNRPISQDGPYFSPFPHSGSSYERIRWTSLLYNVCYQACDYWIFLWWSLKFYPWKEFPPNFVQISPLIPMCSFIKPQREKEYCTHISPISVPISFYILSSFPFSLLLPWWSWSNKLRWARLIERGW